MAEVKACIFDLDGVLVDTAVYHYKAWKRLANELGFDFTEKQNEELKGVSRAESLARILQWGGVVKSPAEQHELATLKNEWYVTMIRDMQPDEVLAGVREFLAVVQQAGLKIALGSASKNAQPILEKTQLLSYFDVLVDGNLVTTSKPDPQVFLRGAALLDIPPAQCVVFEDAIAGITAARTGNMKAVGVGDPQLLTSADLVIPGMYAMTIEKLFAL